MSVSDYVQKIDGVNYVSIRHWGMFPIAMPHWESRDGADWDSVPFEMDMQRAANMMKGVQQIKIYANRLGRS